MFTEEATKIVAVRKLNAHEQVKFPWATIVILRANVEDPRETFPVYAAYKSGDDDWEIFCEDTTALLETMVDVHEGLRPTVN